jgi:hypothetical protein
MLDKFKKILGKKKIDEDQLNEHTEVHLKETQMFQGKAPLSHDRDLNKRIDRSFGENTKRMNLFASFKKIFQKSENEQYYDDVLADEQTIAGRHETVQLKAGKQRSQRDVKKVLLMLGSGLLLCSLVYLYLGDEQSELEKIIKSDSPVKKTQSKVQEKSQDKEELTPKTVGRNERDRIDVIPPQKQKEESWEEDLDEQPRDLTPVATPSEKTISDPTPIERTVRPVRDEMDQIENKLKNSEVMVRGLSDLRVNYYASGAGLVYNCEKKHWACIDRENFLKCSKLSDFNPITCFAVKGFASKNSCKAEQINRINRNSLTGFCGN